MKKKSPNMNRLILEALFIQKSKSCTAVPNKPSTQAKLEVILDEEKKIDIDKLVEDIVKKSKLLKC